MLCNHLYNVVFRCYYCDAEQLREAIDAWQAIVAIELSRISPQRNACDVCKTYCTQLGNHTAIIYNLATVECTRHYQKTGAWVARAVGTQHSAVSFMIINTYIIHS